MADEPKVFAFGGFEVDESLQELRREGRPVELHATPLRLLLYLLRNRDRVVPKEELLDQVWPGAVVSEDALFSALKEIRHALGETGSKEHTVETLRGRGYRLVVPVEEHPTAASLEGAQAGRRLAVLTWRNVILGGVLVGALAGVGIAGWLLLGGEIARPPGPIRSLAVLPLENLSDDPEQEYFADGMTDAVISEFARLGSLRVISRTSVMRYKQSDKSLPEIAQDLNVQGVVEGSMFRAGDRVRITLQLIDGRDDSHLWAQAYERDLRDVLALQGEIARAVAEQIRIELTPDEQEALTPSRTVDPRAYDAYLRGRQLMRHSTLVVGWGPAAIKQLERSVELDPDFAEGWRGLAGTRLALGIMGYRGEFPKARQAAQRALEIDDRLVGAHSTLGFVRYYYDWDFPGARRAFERALQLSPSDPGVLIGYAWYLLQAEGRTEEALDFSERLLRVAPLDPYLRGELVGLFRNARQYERALKELEQIRELDPDFASLDVPLLYLAQGRIEEARLAYIAFFGQCGTPCDWMREAFERGWAEGGPEGAVRAFLEVATTIEGFSPQLIAASYAFIGETDEAFAWLERGYRERDPRMVQLKSESVFDPLRSDPRFDDLLRRIGFPEE